MRLAPSLKLFLSPALRLSVCPPTAGLPLHCETVWELFREQECTGSAQSSAAGGEEGGEEDRRGGFFPLDEVMDDGFSQSLRQTRPWPPSASSYTNTWKRSERWHPLFIWARYATANLSVFIIPPHTPASSANGGEVRPRRATLTDSATWKALLKSASLQAERWKWLAHPTISMLSRHTHWRSWFELSYCLIPRSDMNPYDGMRDPVRGNRRDDRMMAVIILITQPPLLPGVWVTEPTLCGFVLRCEKYHPYPSLSPLPRRGFRECDITPKLCQGTIGPPSECDTSLWDVWQSFSFTRSLILSVWDGLVGVIFTTQPTLSRPMSHFYLCFQTFLTYLHKVVAPQSETLWNSTDTISVWKPLCYILTWTDTNRNFCYCYASLPHVIAHVTPTYLWCFPEENEDIRMNVLESD